METLSDQQNTILENDYNIKANTIIPSIYGRKQCNWELKNDLTVENELNYHKVIAIQISLKVDVQRPVFVVFESKKDLYAFHNSDAFKSNKLNAAILTEEANLQEKKVIISKATSSGKITLFTKIFGRGTDFILHDKHVKEKGGVHVIQTFLSDELSEEIQIRGRTARQGEPGSYSMILCEKQLQKYNVLPKDLEEHSHELYTFLDEKRMSFFSNQYSENI